MDQAIYPSQIVRLDKHTRVTHYVEGPVHVIVSRELKAASRRLRTNWSAETAADWDGLREAAKEIRS